MDLVAALTGASAIGSRYCYLPAILLFCRTRQFYAAIAFCYFIELRTWINASSVLVRRMRPLEGYSISNVA
jgi:hypothetical protein